MRAVFRDGNLIWINGAGYGNMAGSALTFQDIPEQDVSFLFQWVEDIETWKFTGTNNDINWEFALNELPYSEHIGRLVSVTPSLAKPAVVRRKYLGVLYDVSCFVTESVKDDYQANKIQIGDYVLVSFIEETPDETEKNVAIVTGKVFESW